MSENFETFDNQEDNGIQIVDEYGNKKALQYYYKDRGGKTIKYIKVKMKEKPEPTTTATESTINYSVEAPDITVPETLETPDVPSDQAEEAIAEEVDIPEEPTEKDYNSMYNEALSEILAAQDQEPEEQVEQQTEEEIEDTGTIHSESQFSIETSKSFSERAREAMEKAKKSGAFKKVVIAALAASVIIGGLAVSVSQHNKAEPTESSTVASEFTEVSGEQENGVKYDYTGYQSPEKLHKNNFGEDLRQYHGDREAMVKHVLEEAKNNPEMLVSEAYHVLTPSQKREIGIDGMTVDEIDKALDGENGGELQQKIYDAYSNVMNDPNTDISFVENSGRVWSYTEYTVDENGDRSQTPDETHLGMSEVVRNNAKQFVVVNKTGDEKTISVFNEYCGAQIDTKEKEKGLKTVGEDDDTGGGETTSTTTTTPDTTKPTTPDTTKPTTPDTTKPTTPDTTKPTTPDTTKPTTPETTTTTTTKLWGKTGDPQGGERVTKSDKVDPSAEVSKEQKDTTNKDNEGKPSVTPGSRSGDTDSNKKPTNNDRKTGGENQGGSNKNGENAYQNKEKIEEGQKKDQFGNESQSRAQSGTYTYVVGGNNYSDSAEEQAVEEGDF